MYSFHSFVSNGEYHVFIATYKSNDPNFTGLYVSMKIFHKTCKLSDLNSGGWGWPNSWNTLKHGRFTWEKAFDPMYWY